MKIPWTARLCEADGVNAARHVRNAWLLTLLVAAGFQATAQSTNTLATSNGAATPAHVESVSTGLDESAFRLVIERNIFNANRSGGQVRLASQRPARVETFTLVGTLAYAKGTFAFFEGSSSEFTKVLKADNVIAGHKLVAIYANSVKLEADGKEIELPVGSQMRREDEGTWHVAEASDRSGGSSYALNRNGDSSGRDSSSRNSRSDRSRGGDSRSRRDGESSRGRTENSSDSGNRTSSNTSTSSADQAEILKRLMERREKESQ